MNACKIFLFTAILLAAVAIPSSAYNTSADTFNISINGTPAAYAVDYLPGNVSQLVSYSINTSVNVTDNQTWELYGYTEEHTFDLLDNQTDVNFTEHISRTYIPCINNSYRFFFLYFDNGFELAPFTIITFNSNVSEVITPTTTTPIPIMPPAKRIPSSQENWLQSTIVTNWQWVLLLILILLYLLWRKGR